VEIAIATFLLGIAVSICGYFLKRWWEGQSGRERIQEVVQLASIQKELSRGEVTLEALSKLKDEINERALSSQKYQQQVVADIGNKLDDYEPQSQAEMNQYSSHLADLAEREMRFLAGALEPFLTESEIAAFKSAQSAWKKYATKQADFESLEWEGGSMRPLIYWGAYRQLVIERAASLKEELNKRNQIDIEPQTL
jgi:uncharacterized protein YecT (DUF1311 family)